MSDEKKRERKNLLCNTSGKPVSRRVFVTGKIQINCKKMVFVGQAVSEKKRFEYYGNIHVNCPGVGADEPLGSNCFQNH